MAIYMSMRSGDFRSAAFLIEEMLVVVSLCALGLLFAVTVIRLLDHQLAPRFPGVSLWYWGTLVKYFGKWAWGAYLCLTFPFLVGFPIGFLSGLFSPKECSATQFFHRWFLRYHFF